MSPLGNPKGDMVFDRGVSTGYNSTLLHKVAVMSRGVCVCVSGYAFRHAQRYRAESWHGGKGRAREVCGHIFEATPPGVKGHLRVNLP